MIKLVKVNKYFNRRKRNQMHIINNTSLELGDNGLVAILGSSGSGKTTLLNAIGGLDKVNSGKIYINGKKITHKRAYTVDKIRNLNMGYIFQDYKLLENMSVYDNVALSLKMMGIKNKKEIQKRVNYVLEAVKMYRYRNRPAKMLSGGEKQITSKKSEQGRLSVPLVQKGTFWRGSFAESEQAEMLEIRDMMG